MTTLFHHPRELLNAVGQSLGRSDWFLVDQARIDLFSNATNYGHWLAVEPAHNHADPVGPRRAPEYLTLSLVNLFLPQLVDVRGIAMGINIGCGKVRFPAPLTVDSRIRGSGELVEARAERDSIQAVIRVTVELEGSELPACVAETISRYYPA